MENVLKIPILKTLKTRRDSRGWLAEVLKPNDVTRKNFGQILLTVPYPNETKGNHYHKDRVEWFIVLKGKVTFTLTHIKTKKKKVLLLSDNPIKSLSIPPLWHHTLHNITSEPAIVLIYYDRAFEKLKPDTYYL